MKDFENLTLIELSNYCYQSDCDECPYKKDCDEVLGNSHPDDWFEHNEDKMEINRDILSLLDAISDKYNLDVKREIAEDKVLSGAKDLIKGYLEQIERDKNRIRVNQPLTIDELKEELNKIDNISNKMDKNLTIKYYAEQDKYFITDVTVGNLI